MEATLDPATHDLALARAVVYRYLSENLRHPARTVLSEGEWREPLRAALEECGGIDLWPLAERCTELGQDRERVESDYGRIVGHTPRAGVPPYESEWLGAAGDLLQYHQMADIAAFYKAFGLELEADCDERGDHVGVELSFLQFLCAKEAWAGVHGHAELAEVARDGQRGFLGQHVAPWTPAFYRKLGAAGAGGYYAALAELAQAWLEWECQRLGVPCGDPTLAPGESSITLEDTCISCAHSSSCVPGGVERPSVEPTP